MYMEFPTVAVLLEYIPITNGKMKNWTKFNYTEFMLTTNSHQYFTNTFSRYLISLIFTLNIYAISAGLEGVGNTEDAFRRSPP